MPHITWLTSTTLVTVLAFSAGCGSDSDSDGSGGGGTGASGGSGGGTGASGGSGGSAGGATGGAAGSGASGGSGGTGGSAPCTLGTTWQVVDDYQLSPTQHSNVVGITADSAGNVFAVGLALGPAVGIVRKSTDGGANWDNTPWGEGTPSDANSDAAGNVYVMTGFNGRVLRKTSDGGANWTDIDSIPFNPSGPNEPCNTGFVAVSPSGAIVIGASCDTTGFIVRKSTNGTTFQDAFTYLMTAGKATRLEGVGVGPNGEAYGTGYAFDAADSGHWITVSDTSSTGTLSDDFQAAAGQFGSGRSFGGTGDGIVAGLASDGNTTQGYLRRLNGGTWTTIDTFTTRAFDVIQVGEQIVVAGTIEENGIERVVTRISVDGGAGFAPLDEYVYLAGKNTRPVALTNDPTGNVYAAVSAQDANDKNHWIVRKLACQ